MMYVKTANAYILAQDDLRGAFGEKSISDDSSVVSFYRHDRTHRLATGIKRVDFTESILGHAASNGLVVLTERQHETKQCALGLVSDLLCQVTLSFTRLSINRCPPHKSFS